MRRAAAIMVMAVARLAAADDGGGAIVGGSEVEGDLAVVALLAGGAAICSGTLISPDVVLTAGHCAGVGVDQVFIGSAPDREVGQRIAVADIRRHPGYVSASFANDLALVLLATSAPTTVQPARLATRPLGLAEVGDRVRIVGFGWTSAAAEPPRKRAGQATVTDTSMASFTIRGDVRTCRGDSGGPAFTTEQGGEVLVGVTSNGDAACAAFGRDVQVAGAVTDFITPYLVATAPGAAGPGDRCFRADGCATGTCVEAVDAPGHRYCATTCEVDDDCLPPMACVDGDAGRACAYAAPSPGAEGHACAAAWDCATGVCAADLDGERACARGCHHDGECRADEACAAGTGDEVRRCVPDGAAAGCGVGPRPGLGLVLLGLMAWAAGRHRRPRAGRRPRTARALH